MTLNKKVVGVKKCGFKVALDTKSVVKEIVKMSLENLITDLNKKVGELKEENKKLKEQLDAKIVLINNGWEEERYLLQDKVARYEKALKEILLYTGTDYSMIPHAIATKALKEGE